MAGQSVRFSLASIIAAPFVVDARFEWYLGFGGGNCVETCAAFGRECVPARVPADAIEMQSVALEAHHACANIRKVGAGSTLKDLIAPMFEPPSDRHGSDEHGICWYPANQEFSTCAASPAAALRSGDKVMQRFCACSEVKGKQWVLGNPSQNCDSACANRGGMCGNKDEKWPLDQTSMSTVVQSAGATCSSISYGVSDAAPNFGDSGVCHWAKSRNGRSPECSASAEGVRRFCPCYDVSSTHMV